jgi:iron complex outermembrane receptor protein/vitamin B12 transporter
MQVRSWRGSILSSALFFILGHILFCRSTPAAIVHGTVTNPLGIGVVHASVVLVQNGQILAVALTRADGTYQITSSASGRFYVLTSASNFKQITSLSFYAGAVDSREEDVVLEPANVRQEIVTSATGTPLPEAQVSAAVTVQRSGEFRNRINLVDPLRQVPGVFAVQQGQYGGLTSIFIRGSNPDANHVNLDGVPIGDIGGSFDYSNLSTAGVGQFEVYRGPNSVLYGSDASAGVVTLTTPRGSTPFPSFFYEGDAGSHTSFRNLAQLGGTYKRLDYYGGFDAFQSDNDIQMDEYHDDTATANLGYAYSAATQFRVTARNSDAAVGTPGPFNFYGIANAGKQSDQDIYLGAAAEHWTIGDWHNLVRYGMTRKREEDINFYAAGIPLTITSGGVTSTNYYGYTTDISGANGYSVTGQAVLNFPGTYPNTLERVNNRDQVYFQSDYPFTPHILGLFTFRYEDERGAKKSVAYGIDQNLERANYDYTAQIQGSYRSRLFYSLGGGAEKNQLFGTVGTPRIGLAYYPVRPDKGLFHGTKIRFNFANGYQEPSLDEQFAGLYDFLLAQQGGQEAIQQFHISPIGAEQSRTYEGGVGQSFLNERGMLRVSYFHNTYGRQIESVPATEVPTLLPQLSPSEQQALESLLNNAGGIDLNSQAFRAQGIESEVEYSLFKNLFMRGGYTYLDAVVLRSFTSDALKPAFNTGLPGGPAPPFSDVPIGAFGPLRGARPFNRPPHTAYAAVSYNGEKYSVGFTAAFASRSDDSTFLGGRDIAGGDSLLLPNRNLDASYTKLDLGGSYQFLSWLAVYAQLDNLTGNKRIGQIGYPSLPFTFRVGLRLALGHTGSK